MQDRSTVVSCCTDCCKDSGVQRVRDRGEADKKQRAEPTTRNTERVALEQGQMAEEGSHRGAAHVYGSVPPKTTDVSLYIYTFL